MQKHIYSQKEERSTMKYQCPKCTFKIEEEYLREGFVKEITNHEKIHA
jgi:hypothetical protein